MHLGVAIMVVQYCHISTTPAAEFVLPTGYMCRSTMVGVVVSCFDIKGSDIYVYFLKCLASS